MASFSVAGFGTVLAFPPAGLSGGADPDGGWVGLGGWFLRRVGFVTLIVAMEGKWQRIYCLHFILVVKREQQRGNNGESRGSKIQQTVEIGF